MKVCTYENVTSFLLLSTLCATLFEKFENLNTLENIRVKFKVAKWKIFFIDELKLSTSKWNLNPIARDRQIFQPKVFPFTNICDPLTYVHKCDFFHFAWGKFAQAMQRMSHHRFFASRHIDVQEWAVVVAKGSRQFRVLIVGIQPPEDFVDALGTRLSAFFASSPRLQLFREHHLATLIYMIK